MKNKLNALDPNYILVDERSMRDRLCFVAHFVELIYFYDENNEKHGNWSPFFLKDPVILLAYISKTNYNAHYVAYSQISRKWVQYQYQANDQGGNENDLTELKLLDQLFFLLYALFRTINCWVVGMGMCGKKYPLKDFVYKQVREVQSVHLWNVLALQKQSAFWLQKLQKDDPTIPLPDYSSFEKFRAPWSGNQMGKRLIGLTHEDDDGTQGGDNQKDTKKKQLKDTFNALLRIHRQTFDFYVRVIENAAPAFEEMIQEKQNPFPDTLLMVVFAKLMQLQQDQLNQLTLRHLEFYYKKVLDQKAAGAVPDEAFVILQLNPNTESFPIPKGFQFNAGVDAEQNPILFESEKDSVVNQIAIDQVSTLSPKYLRHIEKPSQIKKNEKGEVLTWDTFGDSKEDPSFEKEYTPVQLGFAFASPMLYLGSGTRTITLTFQWSDTKEAEDTSQPFKDCEFYLSTEKEWYQVDPQKITIKLQSSGSSTVRKKTPGSTEIKFTLQPSAPPIVPFKKNPDKFTTSLPMFKVIFHDSSEFSKEILLKDITIKAHVTGMSEFQLSNDQGSLPSNAPFLPFGPIPSVGSRFSLVSRELLGKILYRLTLIVNWDQVPDNFSQYYSEYNSYLENYPDEVPSDEKRKNTLSDTETEKTGYFHNGVFTANFQPPTKDKNPVPLFQPCYELTIPALKSLDKEGVHKKILCSLKPLIGKKYGTKDQFLEAVKEKTGENLTCKYQEHILEAAMKAPSFKLTHEDLENLRDKKLPPVISNKKAPPKDSKFWKVLKNIIIWALQTFWLAKFPLISTIITNLKDNKLWEILKNSITGVWQKVWHKKHPSKGDTKTASSRPDHEAKNNLSYEKIPQDILDSLGHLKNKEHDSDDKFLKAVKETVGKFLVKKYNKPILEQGQTDYLSFISKFKFKENALPSGSASGTTTTARAGSGTITMTLAAPGYAFGHTLYPKVVSWISLKNARIISDPGSILNWIKKIIGIPVKEKKLNEMPNPPYIPKIKNITVDYTAQINQPIWDNLCTKKPYPFEYFHYSPFGAYPVFSTTTTLDYGVLAQGETVSKDSIDLFPYIPDEGILYLSLKNLPTLPATLSIYFEVAEDKGPKNGSSEDQSIKFWVLAKEGWQQLLKKNSEILEDGTANLTQSGIILLALPEDLSQDNPMMPGDHCWISITKKIKESPPLQTVYLNTQAIQVKRVESGPSQPGVTPVIQAGKIVSPAVKTPEIKEVLQPFPSENGRAAETKEAFYKRVSRRIKTKDRALSGINYASMVMEADPQLAYAKCLPKKNVDEKLVRIELVQGYPHQSPPTAFQPVVPSHQRNRLQEYFRTRISPFVSLKIEDMDHQEVQVSCVLVLEEPENGGMAKKKINEELRLFLSPWIQSEQLQIPIDQGIRRSELLSFLSGQPEVLYVKSIGLGSNEKWQSPPVGGTIAPTEEDPYPYKTKGDWDAVFPESKQTLFVSAEKHEIEIK